MNIYDASEQAYKRGYEAGQRDARKRGRWEKTCVPDVYQCTHCKRPTKMDELCDSEILRAYCPNCGADMRGEEDG